MFAVVNHLQFTKPVDELLDAMEQEGLPLLASNHGFRDFHFVKVTDNNAIVIILWEDAASAQDGAKSFGQTWFAKNFKPFLVGEEQRSVGQIILSYNK